MSLMSEPILDAFAYATSIAKFDSPPPLQATIMLLLSLCVTMGDTAALSLIRLTMPRASANTSRGVSHPPVAARAAPPTQQRQKPLLDKPLSSFMRFSLSCQRISGYELFFRNGECHRFTSDDPVCGVGQLEEHLIQSGRQANDDDRFAAGVDEVPWRVVYRDMDVANARRYVHSTLAEHRHHPQMFRPILDEGGPSLQLLRKRWIDD